MASGTAAFRALIDALPHAIAVHRNGTYLFVNPATLRLLGYDAPGELVGRSVLDTLHPDDHEAVRERISRMMRDGTPVDTREERLVRRDGEEVLALVHAQPIPWDGGPAALVFAQDDNGVGITEDQLGRVFEPYFTTKPAGEGTGLGLWMVRGLVERLGGEVAVRSSAGAGTSVVIELPTVPGAPEVRATPDLLPARGLRVLIVDDEPDIASLIGEVLGGDHQVRVLTSGRQAVDEILAADPPWDLVLCDVMMPDLGGRQLWEEVARRRQDLVERLVFLTGGAFSAEAQAFVDEAGARVLCKPLHARDLRALVTSVAGRR